MNLRARLGRLEATSKANHRPFSALGDDDLNAQILASMRERARELGLDDLVQDDGRLSAGGISTLAVVEPDADLAHEWRELRAAIAYAPELFTFEHPRSLTQ